MTSDELIATVKKQPIGFACGVICLACIALLYFRGSKIEERQAEYEAKSAEASMIVTNVLNSAKLPEQVAEIQALSKELDSRLIRGGQLAVNQQYFYKLEAETEVKMSDMRQNPLSRGAKAPTLYSAIPFTLSVQGSFSQLLVFLQRLETGPHFCRFTSVSFVKSAAAADFSSMTLSLNLELLGTP